MSSLSKHPSIISKKRLKFHRGENLTRKVKNLLPVGKRGQWVVEDQARYRASDGRSGTIERSGTIRRKLVELSSTRVHCILLDEGLPSKSNVPNEYRIDAADNGRHEVGIIEVER